MEELQTYLLHDAIRTFPPEELNEVLLSVYNVLVWTVRDQGDELRLTPTHFEWRKQGTPVGSFRIDRVKPSVSFRSMLEKIVARDPAVRAHLQFVAESPDEVTYRLQDVSVELAA